MGDLAKAFDTKERLVVGMEMEGTMWRWVFVLDRRGMVSSLKVDWWIVERYWEMRRAVELGGGGRLAIVNVRICLMVSACLRIDSVKIFFAEHSPQSRHV